MQDVWIKSLYTGHKRICDSSAGKQIYEKLLQNTAQVFQRDREREVHCCWCCCGGQMWHLFCTSIVIGSHICSKCEGSEKSTLIWKITRLPFHGVIFTLKILRRELLHLCWFDYIYYIVAAVMWHDINKTFDPVCYSCQLNQSHPKLLSADLH